MPAMEAQVFKTILVANDGSTHAKKALSLACDIAQKYGARLVIMHVLLSNVRSEALRQLANRRALSKRHRDLLESYEADAYTAMAAGGEGAMFVVIPAPQELLTAIGRQILDRAESDAKKAGVSKVSTTICGGDPADTILTQAKGEKADMIVLGSRGLGDFKGLFLGSVSHKVSARAECTCVTVK